VGPPSRTESGVGMNWLFSSTSAQTLLVSMLGKPDQGPDSSGPGKCRCRARREVSARRMDVNEQVGFQPQLWSRSVSVSSAIQAPLLSLEPRGVAGPKATSLLCLSLWFLAPYLLSWVLTLVQLLSQFSSRLPPDTLGVVHLMDDPIS
jgi:hypothetical protein